MSFHFLIVIVIVGVAVVVVNGVIIYFVVVIVVVAVFVNLFVPRIVDAVERIRTVVVGCSI